MSGRVVLITGGNRGIGLACANAFVAAGDRVAVGSRSGLGPAGTFGVKLDVTSAEGVATAFEAVESEFGPVEVLVSNAGVTNDTLLLTMTEDDFHGVIDTNLVGAYRVAKRAARGMLRMRTGRLIFISSAAGLTGSPGQSNYAASKSGLVGFARSIAREMAQRSITANVVAPGPIHTSITEDLTDEQRAALVAAVPLHRMGTPEEVAGAVLFLASPAAAYITGAVLPVDGGLGMGH
ncbi:MAG: 3-oxoacyl-ACP reductase FabG [Frankia sp.]